eukprot:TRINITY_DN9710_c0_g1_i2.p1 TRINITY_DN9710_c0_g1~~TRINITY_DN9710_c0_g1_i2.p1  ORF type:complete len:580 (+),score=64.90 TRINITY_DN9710_c0_g1_i2:843-2582(+)
MMLGGSGTGRRRSSTPARGGTLPPTNPLRKRSASSKRSSGRRSTGHSAKPPAQKQKARRKTNNVNDHSARYEGARRFPRFNSYTATWWGLEGREVAMVTPPRGSVRLSLGSSRGSTPTPLDGSQNGTFSAINTLWAKEMSRVMYVDKITAASVVLQKAGRGWLARGFAWQGWVAYNLRRLHSARRIGRWWRQLRQRHQRAESELMRRVALQRRLATLRLLRACTWRVGKQRIAAATTIQNIFYRRHRMCWRMKWEVERMRGAAVQRLQRCFRLRLARLRVRLQRAVMSAWEYPARAMQCQRRGITTQERFERNSLTRYHEYLMKGQVPPTVLFTPAVVVTPAAFAAVEEAERTAREGMARRAHSRFLSIMDALRRAVAAQQNADEGREMRLLRQYDDEIAQLNATFRTAPIFEPNGGRTQTVTPSRSSLWCVQGTPVPETPGPREASPVRKQRGREFRIESASVSYTLTRGLTPEVVSATTELWGRRRALLAGGQGEARNGPALARGGSLGCAALGQSTPSRPQSAPPYLPRGPAPSWQPQPPAQPPVHARTPTPSYPRGAAPSVPGGRPAARMAPPLG